MENEITVADAKEGSRYEARDAGGTLMGFVDYHLHPGVITFVHAETLPEFRGRGVAGRIAAWGAHVLVCLRVLPEFGRSIAWGRSAAGPLLRAWRST